MSGVISRLLEPEMLDRGSKILFRVAVVSGVTYLALRFWYEYEKAKKRRASRPAHAADCLFGEEGKVETRYLFIPKEFIGGVLGRRGATLRQIEFETKTQLHLCRASEARRARTSEFVGRGEEPDSDDEEETDWFEEAKVKAAPECAFLRVRAHDPKQFTLVETALKEVVVSSRRSLVQRSMSIKEDDARPLLCQNATLLKKLLVDYDVKVYCTKDGTPEETITVCGATVELVDTAVKVIEKYIKTLQEGRDLEVEADEEVEPQISSDSKKEDVKKEEASVPLKAPEVASVSQIAAIEGEK